MERSELVDRLRTDAAERRRLAGPTRVPPLEDPRSALDAVLATRSRADQATSVAGDPAALADPMDVELRSHRRVGGAVARSVKQILLRLLTNVLARQGQFNEETCAEVRALRRKADSARIGLEARLDAVEGRASQASGRLAPAYPAFDYDAFERAFRGSIDDQRRSLAPYVPLLREAGGVVLDLGCGRGELLAVLQEEGISARGVDLDLGAVAEARKRGLDVTSGDLLDALRACGDASLGAVVALQVVEHLTLRAVRELLALARRKLRPGGLVLLETVNVASGYALTHGWTIDPTHRLRLHPRVLRELAVQAGFREAEIRLGGAVAGCDRVEAGSKDGSGEASLEWLFAPQDCALLARA
jgi:SAM-dependent methyltransferase